MTTAALGGPELALANAFSEQARTRIAVRSIYQQGNNGAFSDVVLFSPLLVEARRKPGTIINLSLRS